jgi:hypothetical protein
MNIEMMRDFFLWSVAISYAILFLWFLVFMLGREWIRRFHGRWFRLSDESFDVIHYAGMAVFKIGIILFALVPYITLCVINNAP